MEYYMTGNDAEILAAIIAMALLLGGVGKMWMLMWGRIATHESRLNDRDGDVLRTVQILDRLVPVVATLEERTKRM